jgi:hypothetical protein
MSLKYYVPISVVMFVLVVCGAYFFSVPILPFALVLLAGETLLGFEVEDHKVPRFLSEVFRAPKR